LGPYRDETKLGEFDAFLARMKRRLREAEAEARELRELSHAA
jgi:hypothetical protein